MYTVRASVVITCCRLLNSSATRSVVDVPSPPVTSPAASPLSVSRAAYWSTTMPVGGGSAAYTVPTPVPMVWLLQLLTHVPATYGPVPLPTATTYCPLMPITALASVLSCSPLLVVTSMRVPSLNSATACTYACCCSCVNSCCAVTTTRCVLPGLIVAASVLMVSAWIGSSVNRSTLTMLLLLLPTCPARLASCRPPPPVTIIVKLPSPMPLTTPALDTVATLLLLELKRPLSSCVACAVKLLRAPPSQLNTAVAPTRVRWYICPHWAPPRHPATACSMLSSSHACTLSGYHTRATTWADTPRLALLTVTCTASAPALSLPSTYSPPLQSARTCATPAMLPLPLQLSPLVTVPSVPDRSTLSTVSALLTAVPLSAAVFTSSLCARYGSSPTTRRLATCTLPSASLTTPLRSTNVTRVGVARPLGCTLWLRTSVSDSMLPPT